MHGMMRFFFVGVLLLATLTMNAAPQAATTPIHPDPVARYAPLGTNIGSVVDWTTEMPFTDQFKMARDWFTQCRNTVDPGCTGQWDTQEQALLDLDEHGWVRSLPAPEADSIFTIAASLMFVGDDRLNYGGQYLVLYDGTGTIQYGLGASKDQAASAPGRDVVNVADTGMFLLQLVETDPQGNGDYIRNIRVVRPEAEATYATQIWNPVFVERIAPFRTLRFMDWMRTNDSRQAALSDRPLPSDATYTTAAGVPVEIMVALVNKTGQDPWFTMPHLATDEYFTEFATLVRNSVHAKAKIYVEYSNETWNGQFAQAQYVREQGAALWTEGTSFQQGVNWHGLRTAQMCDAWKQAWGTEADRVVCVMGSQAANQWVAQQALECPLWTQGGPCVDHGIAALAIAPYFGGYLGDPGNQAEVAAWTTQADGGLDTLFAEITAGGELTNSPEGGALAQALSWITANHSVADQHRLDLIAYEGGQHLVGHGGVENNQAIMELFIAANRDPRMETIYRTYLDGWRAQGGELFAHFSLAGAYSKWGNWGALEYINQPGSPKYNALLAFIDRNPCWWAGCAVTYRTTFLPVMR